jgi:hypothetical protein
MNARLTSPKGTADVGLAFHFTGEVLGTDFRLLSHLRSEAHGEVYSASDLSGVQKYEVKAYVLGGIYPNQRKHRLDNLKKLTSRANFVLSLDQNNVKYCIFNVVERKVENVKLKLGAIGRRNTSEWKAAFPELPKVARKSSIEPKYGSYA